MLELLDLCRRRGLAGAAGADDGRAAVALAPGGPGARAAAVRPAPAGAGRRGLPGQARRSTWSWGRCSGSWPRRSWPSRRSPIKLEDRGPVIHRSRRVGVEESRVHLPQAAHDARRRGGASRSALEAAQRGRRRALQDPRGPARDPGRAACCGGSRSTSCPSSGTSCAGRCRWSARGRCRCATTSASTTCTRSATWCCPGLTGLWQVSGRSDLSFDELVRLDFYYIETWSIWLDLTILARTIPVVLRPPGGLLSAAPTGRARRPRPGRAALRRSARRASRPLPPLRLAEPAALGAPRAGRRRWCRASAAGGAAPDRPGARRPARRSSSATATGSGPRSRASRSGWRLELERAPAGA